MTSIPVRMAILMLALFLVSHRVAAQETRLAAQAMHCAAIFSLLAKAYAAEPDRGPRWSKAVEIFTDVHIKATSGTATNKVRDAAVKRRTEEAQTLLGAWTAGDAYLKEETVICGAWVEGFLAQGETYQYVPVYPKVVAPGVRSQYQYLFSEAMGR
jgi:hypothetical protein